MIYNQHRTKLIKETDLEQIDQEQKGYYRVQLNPGTYIVDINLNHVGIDRSSDVPKEIETRLGESVEVNIDIDTGIR